MVDHRVDHKTVRIVVVVVHKQVVAAAPTGFAVHKVEEVEEVAVRMVATSGAGSTGLVVLVLPVETVGTATGDREIEPEDTGTGVVGLAVAGEVCYTPTALGDTVKMRRSLEEVVV